MKPYVLRFWEAEFPAAAPDKSSSGQRVYRRPEVETLLLIKSLLYTERYSIEGARKRLKELKKQGLLREAREQAASPQARPAAAPQDAVASKEPVAVVLKGLVRDLQDQLERPIRELFQA